MSDLTSLAATFSNTWGAAPATVDLLAFAAIAQPDAVAFEGAAGPVTFATLNAQVAITAGVFAAQGLDPDAAVGAAVTPAIAAGRDPAEIAETTKQAIESIRSATFAVIGSRDLGSLPGIFRSVATRFPDRIALTDMEGAQLTYAELDARSDAVATGLIAAGAGPEQLVGVGLSRNAELIIALLGVTKSGAAYLPLDQSHPVDRLAAIVDDARPVIALTDRRTIADWADLAVECVTVEEVIGRADGTDIRLPAQVHGAHPAYVMYTSGSTGRPKGVVVTHDDVVTLLWAMGQEYDYSPEDVWTMFQSYAFDVSVGEIWVALAFGGRLVVLDYLTTRTPDRFVEVLAEESVTIVNLTPSAFYQLAGALREPAPGRLSPSVRSMIFVGEALDFEQVRRWFADRRRYDANDGPELNNMYGPTEATVYLTRRLLTPAFVEATLASDVGVALPKSRMYVLDSRLAMAPEGIPGDLYLAGDQLARGYSGRFGLNATRFVADPYGAPGDRMYQSGDVAIFRDGSLEFLGRADDQVKLRGYRIELGEVEAGLLAAEGVNAAAAAIKRRPGFPDQLVGYVVGATADGGDLDPAEIRRSAAIKVPDYMVPDIIMLLDQLPLNVNGKLDRKALPQPVITAAAEYVAPTGHTETVVARVFAEVLGLDRISAVESVFDVGGNSLLAARIVGRACDELGVELNLRDLFEAPTVQAFAERAAHVDVGLPPVVKIEPRPTPVPLSFAQQRMWFINQFDPTEATYNLPALLRLTGDVDIAALRAAVEDAVVRHEVLRTTFPSVDGTPVQAVSGAATVPQQLDWQVVTDRDQLAAAVATGFDVAAQWPLRARLWAVGDGSYVFALVVHHIAADGESMRPLVADIVTAYTARAEEREPAFGELPVQFADYAIWQHQALGSADDADSVLGKQLGYWREQLAGVPEVIDLPADRPRPKVASHEGAQVGFTIPANVGERVEELARSSGTTAFMVVHAALATMLSRLTATDDIAIATPIAGRGQSALDDLVGMFVNTLVLRTRVDTRSSFNVLLDQVRTIDLDAFAHADVPFESVVEALAPVRSEAFSPLAQVMLSFDPAASAERLDLSVGGVDFELLDPPSVPAQLDLSMIVRTGVAGGDWSGTAVFATDLFDAGTVEALVDRFVRLLDVVTAAPAAALGDAAVVTVDECRALLSASTGPVRPVSNAVVADAVSAQVGRIPEVEALWFEGRSVSYAEFGARVNTLARELVAAGVGPDVAVGVCIDRSVEMVVAVHAVVAAGGQYVPIDTAAPVDRVEYMTATAGVRLVLVSAHDIPAAVSGVRGVTLMTVDADSSVDARASAAAPLTDADRLAPLSAEDALYTMFTSGSTGRPKGVTVSHGAVANRLWWGLDAFPWGADDRIVQKTPYTFDVSVPELFAPLMAGASMVIARPGGHADPDYLVDLLVETAATSVHFVPSMLSVFLDVVDASRLARVTALKWLFASGEALAPAIVAKAHAAWPSVGIHNLFGPTEAAVEVSWADVSDAPPVVTIGAPVWNTETLVLDDRLAPVPAGVPGELYLGGVQVARGYAAQPRLTAERFVADPFGAAGARLYRTGDLVRWNRDGQIEYLGRTDFQVKLRGQRIELGEIETVLAGAEGVVKAAVAVATAPGGAEHLVAYVSPATVDVGVLRETVAQALPEYMVPSVWTVVDDIAVNSAGKIDRRSLPEPDFGSAEVDYVAPAGLLEEQLAAVVSGLLGVDRVSVTESFFALGGDSIMSIQLASAMRAVGHTLSPRQIFEHRTIRAMAAAIEEDEAGLPLLSEPADGPAGETVIPPMVSWMIEHADSAADFADYSQALTLAAPADLTAEALADVLAVVVAHHPMLTASLTEDAGTWAFTAGRDFDAAAAVTVTASAATVGTEEFDDELVRAHARAAAALDPATGALVHAALVTDATGTGRIVLVIHHIGVDAVSWRAVIEDLVTVWAQRAAGTPYRLRDNTTSARAWFAELAARRSEWINESDHWLSRLPAEQTDFGADLDRDRDRQSTTATIEHRVAAAVAETLLTTAPDAFGGNVSDVLLAGLSRAVRSWQRARGIDDHAPVSILVEGHGRYEEALAHGTEPVRADLSRSVGWFTTIAPINVDPSADVVHAVKAAKEERLSQPDGGIGFGWLRYGADTELATRPLPSIVFNYLGTAAAGAEDTPAFGAVAGPALPSSPSGAMAAQAVLTVNVSVESDGAGRRLVASMNAPVALLGADALADLADRWTAELIAIADVLDTGAGVGLSPSDVAGIDITQGDLDAIDAQFPGAAVWPLSPLQGGLYFQSAFAADSTDALDVYVAQAVLDLGAGVDAAKLEAAARTVLAEHRVLRSGFVPTASGTVVAVVPDHVNLPWQTITLSAGLDTDAVAEEIRDIAEQQRAQPFDLAQPPLLRFVLVRHGESATLIVTNHHIILDGWSGPLVLADVLAVYATGSTYTTQAAGDVGGDYGDYLRLIARRDDAAALEAWRPVLARAEGPTLVSTGVTATRGMPPRDYEVTVDPALLATLESVGRTHGATLSTVLQLAWAVFLSRLTGNRVVTFGETVSGRPADLPGVESMIGLFINTLPAVVDVDPDATVAQILELLQADKVAVLDHQHLSLPVIATAAAAPLGFDTLTIHESYPVDADSLTGTGPIEGALTIGDAQIKDSTHYPLNMVTEPAGEGLTVRLKYLPAAFSDEQIAVFAAAVLDILRGIAATPERPVAEISMDSAVALTGTDGVGETRDLPAQTVADVVAGQIATNYQAPALWFEGRTVTYAEFGDRVNALARRLIGLGVGPESTVAVSMPRSVEMMVAVHAVVAAGGQYVPVDVDAPADRVEYMFTTAGVQAVLTAIGYDPAGVTTAAAELGLPLERVDAFAEVPVGAAPVTDAERLTPLGLDNAVYTLFTSGSTGRPKGVTLTHRAVINRLRWGLDELPIDGSDVVVQKTPYTFDCSVPELFAPFMVGARLVVLKPEGHIDPLYVAQVIEQTRATMVHFVPSMLSVFCEIVGRERIAAMDSIRTVSTTGEALPPAVAAELRAALPAANADGSEGVIFYNLYGPTEAAVEITAERIDEVAPDTLIVPIGLPIWNSSAVVLDSRLRRVPAGVPGELYLGGVQLARGYADRADLTAERFVADPFNAGARLYRTGDLVRYTVDGNMEYLGRTDFQVKLRGQRIELGEIESVLASAPGVVHAAATVADGPGGSQHLVGYISGAGESIELAAVKAAAAESLPGYMVPSIWMVLADIALNSAGKLDRRALPEPDFGAVAGEFTEADGEQETELAEVFAEVLDVDRVSVTESFFDAGGNSLTAMRLAARAGAVLGVEITVRDLFEAPTVRGLIAATSAHAASLAPVTAVVPRPERIPLSFAQQRMWFINRFEPESPVYNLPAVLELAGVLDVPALRAAVADLVGRHEILRTCFPSSEGQPYQLIGDAAEFDHRDVWQVVESEAALADSVMAGFDVTEQWPLRVRLLPRSEDDHVLAIVSHHIAADGESTLPLVTDLLTAYSARSAGIAPRFVPLEVQFADYAIWQHRVLGSADDPDSVVSGQLDYWRGQLAGLPDVLDLPTDRPRAQAASHRGQSIDFQVPADVAARVGALARAAGATEFMVVHAALAALLSRLSATEDIAIGTPIAGRGQAELDPLIGMFVNTLVLRTEVNAGESFAGLVDRVRTVDLDAFAHAEVPFEAVVDAVDPVRSEAFAPLTQVILSFDPGASVAGRDIAVADLTVTPMAPPAVPAQLDLYVTVSTGASGEPWSGSVVFETDIYDAATVEEMMARFVDLLDAVSADSSTAVGDVPLLSVEEIAVLEDGEWGAAVTVPAGTVADVVAAAALRTPEATALWFEGREVSYREFAARANSLARELIAAGVGPESAVAVCVPRSVEMMVAIHAVVAAGGGYVPIDVATPADRVDYMFATAAVGVLLVSADTADSDAARTAAAAGVRVVVVDATGEADLSTPAVTDAERTMPLRPDHAVYTLFTSGSTGRPKGVTLTHEAVVNRLWWGLDELPIDGSDVVVQKTPYTFDCSVPELFAPLMVGATLVVLRDGGHTDPLYVAQVIEDTRATMVHFVPSMMSVFVELVGRERIAAMDHLRIVSTTGEALPPMLAAQVRSWLPDILFYNLYGPTEAAVEITYQRIDYVGADDLTVPIGVPVWNSSAVVLDSRLQRVSAGVPGELYLGGVQLARGYASRGDLTADRFVADPYGEPGSRLYRSGDLVRRLADGGIEYLGRTDFQVKLRGQRIELGEIESVLAGAAGVVHAAATVADGPGGSQHLVGYLAGRPGETLDLDGVTSAAREALPAYMVPSVWMVLDDIALNSAGKLDRKALPVPDFAAVAAEFVAPVGDAEELTAAVFAEVLGVERVSVVDSFFDLGGNSLSAMRLAARAGEALGVELSVRDLFDAPSVRELALRAATAASALPPVMAVVPRPERIPLSFAQQRMWFINQFDPGDATYNMPALLRLTGDLDVDALRSAVVDLVERHEVLRTVFPAVDGVPAQVVAPVAEVPDRIDYQLADSQEEFTAGVTAGFDVSAQWPLRVRVWKQGADEFVLAVVVHHIAADGESMLPLVADLVSAYAARSAGSAPGWSALEVQFADFAIWQHEVLGSPDDPESVVGAQVVYWKDQLAELPSVLELPSDRPRPAVATHRGGTVSFEVAAEVGERISALATASGATPFMVVHAALAVLLSRLSAQDDVAVATPTAGRGQAVLDPVVGMFVNTLVLRSRVRPEMSFVDLVHQVRAVDVDAFEHSLVPFEAVVEAVDPVRSEAFSPLAQVMLSFDPGASLADSQMSMAGLDVVAMDPEVVGAQLDLSVTLSSGPVGRAWSGSTVFATDLFDESSVAAMMTRFVVLLDALTADPSQSVGDVRLLGESEAESLLTDSSGAALPLPVLLAGETLAQQVARTPDAVAVEFGEREVSYREFGSRVASLARRLIAAGVGPDVAVGIQMDRSIEMLVAIHGVIAAGGQYVPLDGEAPVDRMRYVVETADVRLILIAEGTSTPPEFGVEVFELDVTAPVGLDVAPVTDEDRVTPLHAGNAAYTLFTSGSTGRPKGVTVTHRSLGNLLEWFDGVIGDVVDPVVLLKTPYTFDVSVVELFWPLLRGARVVVAEPGGHRDPLYLGDLIARSGVSVVQFVPSMLSVFLAEVDDVAEALASVQRVHIAGEALAPAVANELFEALPTVLAFNHYGPTENTVYATTAVLNAGAPVVTIGEPAPNTTTLVLDQRLRMVPAGVPGELYLGGTQVARGYSAQPGLTAERFVADPYSAELGARMYRTGDLVRWNTDGEVEYLGRTDFQVKLRGQRMELGEVEAVLASVSGVVKAAAAVVTAPGGAEHLLGYVSPASVDVDAVKAVAARSLPSYMVPTMWSVLDDIVLNTAGKVDRRALPAPDFGVVGGEYVAPAGESESAVAAVFAEVLGVDRVSVTQSFFDAGGTSLSAMRLAARTANALGVAVSVRELFEAPSVRELVAAVAGNAAALPPVTAVVPRPERVPLSFAQQRIWFLNRLDPANATYNIPILLRLTGPLDLAAMRAAITDVIARHEILRTTYPEYGGRPYQRVHASSEIEGNVRWLEVSSRAEIAAEVARAFDLTVDWPLRIVLWRISSGEHVLGVVGQHIAMDGESFRPLVADMVTAYADHVAGREPQWAPLEVQFADFAVWQHDVLGSPDDPSSVVSGQLDYWVDRLSGLPGLLEFPMDRPRPVVASNRGAHVVRSLPAELAEALRKIAHDNAATPFMTMHAAFAALMGRIANTADVAVSTPISGRGSQVLDPLVGMFVNSLILRADIDGGASFASLLRQVAASDVEAFAHSDVPFEAVVDAVKPVRSEAFAPLAQIALNFDPTAGAGDGIEVAGLTIDPFDPGVTSAQLDLYLTVRTAPDGEDWSLDLAYATDIFDEARVRQLLDALVEVLRQVLSDPGALIGELVILDAAQEQQIAEFEHGPEVEFPQRLMVDVIADQIRETPDSVALVFTDREVSYREFGARVWSMARELIALGVGPDITVALCMPRSVEMVLAIHAVVAAGGQYMPIAVDAPDERADYMLEITESTLLLVTDRELVAHIADQADARGLPVVSVDASGDADLTADPITDADRTGPLRLDNPMYTLFTSGSTGRPKGVTTPHRGINNRLWWGVGAMPIDGADRVLLKSPYTFDVSLAELFAPLMRGAAMVILPPDVHLDPLALAAEIARTGATTAHFVPSMMSVFLDICGRETVSSLTSLRIISTTGEALPPSMAATVREWLPETMLVNLYGPTEASVEISGQYVVDVTPDDPTVPIGSVVSNGEVAVLDRRLRRVPVGTAGELYIGGVQVGRGYAGRSDLTADRYVADPNGQPGARMYRTGDLVRWNARGELEYLGRTDFQVKLRGQRVELGEIETVISSVPGVVHVAATVLPSATGDQLVAWVAPASAIDMAEMDRRLADALPVYMRPTAWVVLDEMPLNPSGKVNRGVLPAPEFTAAEYVAPQGEREELVAAVFADVLGVEQVSVVESFFDLGGNSLSATRVAARVGQVLGAAVSVRDVFDAPTVRDLAAVAATRDSALAPIAAVDPRPERIPLSFAQQRMWFINQFEPTAPTYNLPIGVRLTGDLNRSALRAAVIDVMDRHEVLRTTFPAIDGEPSQLVHDAEWAATHLDWSTAANRDELAAAAARGFDVTTEAPLRVVLWRCGPAEWVFLAVLHHIAGDGESMRPLIADVITAYLARSDGAAPEFSPLEVQFADFAIWQHAMLGDPADPSSVAGKQLAYWTEQLAGAPEVLNLPTDRPRPRQASAAGAVVRAEIPADVGRRVDETGAAHGATAFMVVHAALAVLLSRLSATDDVTIATPIAGRGDRVLDPLVGMFVNTLVLRTQVDTGASFAALIDEARGIDLDAFAAADVPFESVVDAVAPVRSEAFAPLAQVMLVLDHRTGEAATATAGGLTVEPIDAQVAFAQLDLSFRVGVRDGLGWSVELTYATDLFDEASADRLVQRFIRVLDALTAGRDLAVGDVPLLAETEAKELAGWSRGHVEPLAERTATWVIGRSADSVNGVRVMSDD